MKIKVKSIIDDLDTVWVSLDVEIYSDLSPVSSYPS